MRLYTINKSYIEFLKMFDDKVPDVDYSNKMKLFLGEIRFDVNSEICFYIPITSAKSKFNMMDNRLDFIKIVDPITEITIGALDLNNMIPVPSKVVTEFTYDSVRDNPAFPTQSEKDKYYKFAMNELKYLNNLSDVIEHNAMTIFSMVKTKNQQFDSLRSRCCKFDVLYEHALDFNGVLNNEVNDLVYRIADAFKDYHSNMSNTNNYENTKSNSKGYEM